MIRTRKTGNRTRTKSMNLKLRKRKEGDATSKPFAILERPSLQRSRWFMSSAGRDVLPSRKEKLGQWLATGICGNDITSSCLYVAAIATTYAGALSPIVLLLVAGLLYLYRGIYAEVGDALPLNGGAYNALLNTTTKFKASMAACMTILSYVATAVISSSTAIAYARTILPSLPHIPATLVLLGLFAFLTILGITESARVALSIFVIHMVALTLLLVLGLSQLFIDPSIFQLNWSLPSENSLMMALFLGFSAGLLGVSGFESSANFIEEQKEDVFPKTLRNMWTAVFIFNPLIALIALSVMPMHEIVHPENRDFLLANVAHNLGGSPLHMFISIDAALVLSGAVLTSFVGSAGLIRRMALDRCLPQFLLLTNPRGTQHWIVILFFALCSSIMLLTQGNLLSLAGVYTISFLGVMSLFAIGNILLKVRRAQLPRKYRASWLAILVALAATLSGIFGNYLIDQSRSEINIVKVFFIYFLPTLAFVSLMLFRHNLFRMLLWLANDITKSIQSMNSRLNNRVQEWLSEINSHGIIFFTKGERLPHLNQAMLYVRENEITQYVAVIHVYDDESEIPPNLEHDLKMLDEMYPDVRIELVLRKGHFGPELIEELSEEFGIPKNYMFIGAPSAKFPHRISDLGGVRLII